MPLEHAEDKALQRMSVEQMSVMTGGRIKELMESVWDHHDIIAKFGRFPHRNFDMGREDTPAEDAFLNGEDVPPWGH